MSASRYYLPLKIPPMKSVLARQNIDQELRRHEAAVVQEVVFAGKSAKGFSLMEELEFEGGPLDTPLDRNLPPGRSRKHVLTERVALLGVRWLLERCIFGSPVFHLSWDADSTSYGLQTTVSEQQLVGAVLFSTVDSLVERAQIAENAVSRTMDSSIELVIINFEDAGRPARLRLGAYRRIANPDPDSFRRKNLVLVDIHSGATNFYTD